MVRLLLEGNVSRDERRGLRKIGRRTGEEDIGEDSRSKLRATASMRKTGHGIGIAQYSTP